MSEWQTIETAPKDGNEFLALVLDEHHIMVWDLDEQDWFEANSQSIIGVPTHWMPLPEPPARKGGDA